MNSLAELKSAALAAVGNADDLKSLEDIRVNQLGKKGQLTALLKGLGQLSPEERPEAGAKINEAKQIVAAAIDARKNALDFRPLNLGWQRKLLMLLCQVEAASSAACTR